MTTAYYHAPEGARHLVPAGHAERPARLEAIAAALSAPAFAALDRRAATEADEAAILRCHPAEHLDRLRAAVPDDGIVALDADTYLSPGSLDAAFRAAGACVAAVDAVVGGEVGNAFVGCRPPGHHAERARPMGFCLLGNAAIAAMHALETHGLSRVAIADFDVHHGNGTQDIVWDEARILFASTHQMPLYPGTGDRHETGAHDNVLNVPLAPMSGGAEMRAAYEDLVLPAIRDFEPELLVVSAGFDAHAADPLANLLWSADDFGWLTGRICDVAEAVCGGRVVSTLEGGYDLDALAGSVAAHVGKLMERSG